MAEQQRPDWVVLGVQQGAKVAVYASKELTDAELRYEVDRYEEIRWDPRFVVGPRPRIEMEVRMNTFIVVVADTYEQAFRRLFDTWSPEPERMAIETSQRAIGNGA